MAIRVLSGILMTDDEEGEAVVTFDPHGVEGDARGVGLHELGPSGTFRTPPGKLVALRELSLESRGRASIDDRQFSEKMLRIAWRGARELSYLIIGEVEE